MVVRFLLCAVLLNGVVFARTAAAQGGSRRRAAAEERVRELGRQGKLAYTELDLDKARSLFRRALAKGADAKVSSLLLSQLWVDLGVVEVTGSGANEEGRNAFRNALRLNSKIRPDPLATTPEVQAVFEEALRGIEGAAPPTARVAKSSESAVASPAELDLSDVQGPDAGSSSAPACQGPDCPTPAHCEGDSCTTSAPALTTSEPPRRPLFFVQVGAVLGAAYVKKGMRADSDRPATFSQAQPGPWVDCNDQGEDCNVRIEAAGVSPTVAVRALAGVQVTPRFSTGLSLRFQPTAGVGPLAHWLTGLNARYAVGAIGDRGFYTQLQGGVHYGQIQPRPPQDDVKNGPFVQSGRLGVSAGAELGYRLSRPLALVFTPTALALFGDFLFNMDFVGGVELSF